MSPALALWTSPRLRRLVLAALLAGCGYLGNVTLVPLFFGVDFLFGSIATTIATITLGWGWGGAITMLASIRTIQLWGHPYAAIIFTLEAIWLSLLWRNGRQKLVACDLIFWCTIGIPLVLLFYHYNLALSWQTAVLIAFKQSINGLFCVAVVSLLMLHTPLERWLSQTLELPRIRRSIQEVAFNFLVLIVFIPMLGLTVADSRLARHHLDIEWQNSLQLLLNQTVQTVKLWQIAYSQFLESQPWTLPVHILVHSDADRIEFDQGANFPGFDNLVAPSTTSVEHSDPNNIYGEGGVGNVTHYMPKNNAPPLVLWRNSYYSITQEPTLESPFLIQISTPAKSQIEHLEALYIRNLIILFVVTLVVAVLANIVGRYYFARPLQRLAQATNNIPQKLTDDRELVWPQFALDEVEHLSHNFQAVSQVLKAKFQEIHHANEDLEARVSERTGELKKA